MNAMNAMTVFRDERFGEVRTATINGEPWFVGKDVAIVLGYKNPQEAIRTHVDDDDKGVSEIIDDSAGRTRTRSQTRITPKGRQVIWRAMEKDGLVKL